MKTTSPTPRAPRPCPPWPVWLGLGYLALLLTACDVATSRQPLGERAANLSELHPEGIWRSADGQVFFVRIADAGAGRLELATVKKKDHGFELERTEVLLRNQGEALLASLRGSAPEEERDYVFGRLTLNDDSAVLHLAGTKPLREFARDGAVGAEITTNRTGSDEQISLLVTNGFDRLAAELATPAGWRLLDTRNPVVLIRQRAELD